MKRVLPFAVLAAVAVTAGCRTNKDILDDYEKALCEGRYADPVGEIEGKAGDGGDDELMWRLLAGGSYYLTGDHDKSIANFDKAEDIFLENDAGGVLSRASNVACAMMVNDRVLPYNGAGEDRIFTCLYKAIDYAASGDRVAARTELNRAQQHQDNWLRERRNEIEAAERKLEEDAKEYTKKEGQKNESAKNRDAVKKALADSAFGAQIKDRCGIDPATAGDLSVLSREDWLNVYASHVTGVFRWLSGDPDADVYFKESAALRPGNTMTARDHADASAGVRPEDEVWIFVEDGLCPSREEWRIDLPIGLIPYAHRYVLYAGMALPRLRDRAPGMPSYQLVAAGNVVDMQELENIDRLVKTEFDVYFKGALAREITRTLVAVSVQVGLGIAAQTTKNRNAELGFMLAQVAAASWAAACKQADLRCWTGLPKKVFAVRAKRPADGRILVKGGGAVPIADITLEKGNSMVFIRKPSPFAPAVVKVANFGK